MKEISLTKGKVTLVDDEDYERLCQYKWRTGKVAGNFYAVRSDGVRMHTLLLKVAHPLVVDHKDRDTLNNQKHNLRPATRPQNLYNSKLRSHNTSGFRGVSWTERDHKFRAYITVDRKTRSLGYFDDIFQAKLAYEEASRILHGEFSPVL